MEVKEVAECKSNDENLKAENEDSNIYLKAEKEDSSSGLKVEKGDSSDDEYDNQEQKVIYDSSDDEYDSPEQRNEFHRYLDQVGGSEGFDVDFVPNLIFLGGVYPLNLYSHCSNYFKWAWESAFMAINHHRNKLTELELIDIEKANMRGPYPTIFYLTLEARECFSGEIKLYQARVSYNCLRGNHEVHFIRPRPRES